MKSAYSRSFQSKNEYLLPAKFDDTELQGLRPTTGYIDLRKFTPDEFAEMIIDKIYQKD